MIRNTVFGLVAAAATLAATMGATASSASAGYYGHGYYKPYYKPHYCHKVIVGYDYYGHPIWRCVKKYYRYGY
jgi:hypothetical protein